MCGSIRDYNGMASKRLVNNERYEYVLGFSTKTAQLAASRLSCRWTGVAQARFEDFVGVQSS